eukprot:699236_1
MEEVFFWVVVFIVFIWVMTRDRAETKQSENNRPKRSVDGLLCKQMENEEWVVCDSSNKLVEDLYEDQCEGLEDTVHQQNKLKSIWKSGTYSGSFELPNGTVTQIPPFTLTFAFETDTVVGHKRTNLSLFSFCLYRHYQYKH